MQTRLRSKVDLLQADNDRLQRELAYLQGENERLRGEKLVNKLLQPEAGSAGTGDAHAQPSTATLVGGERSVGGGIGSLTSSSRS